MKPQHLVIPAMIGALTLVGCTQSGSTSATGAGSDTAVLTGKPIELGLIAEGSGPGELLTLLKPGAQAAALAINASGGISGRPIVIDACDTGGNPNGASACARKLVSDGVVALVGSGTLYGTAIMPIAEAADLASIGQIAVGPADLANHDGFPLAPVGIDVVAGEADLLARGGAHKISLARADLGPTAQLAPLAALGLRPHGLQLDNNVAVPVNAPDMSSYVAAATAGGSDGVALLLQGTDSVNFIRAAKDAGYSGRLASDAANLQVAVAEGFGSVLNGVYVVDECKPASDIGDPAVAKMVAQLDKVDDKLTIGYATEDAWASVYLFAQAARGSTTIDAASMLAALPHITDFSTGVFPDIDFSKPLTVIPGLHAFNPYVFYERMQAGKLVPLNNQFVKLLG